MARNWDTYSRQGLDIALAATSFGFHAAKLGTKAGFSIARGIATTAATISSVAVDITLFGGSTVTAPVVKGAVSTALSIAERITLAPLYLGEYITNTSLLAAHSSINVLTVFFPGSSEASFSLVSFIDLVRREWKTPPESDNLPRKQYGITQVARAIVGWVVLQGVTQEWQEVRWFKYLKELDLKDAPTHQDHKSYHKSSRVRVTSDVILPGAQIITANIGEEPSLSQVEKIKLKRTRSKLSMRQPSFASLIDDVPEESMPLPELKATLRRFSKMVLAGYGGASLLFFGVSPYQQPIAASASASSSAGSSDNQEKVLEEAKLASAIDAAEAEAAGEATEASHSPGADPFHQYSWWDVLLGKHDQEIFESSLGHEEQSTRQRLNDLKSKVKASAVIGKEHLMPRFWVLTDNSREQIVLVLRGTMSLNEIAADLTCEPEWFQPAETPPQSSHDDHVRMPGKFTFPPMTPTSGSTSGKKRRASLDSTPRYHVHGGMLKMAKLMGGLGKPVQLAVMEALHSHPDFELVLCGHSLGAGVAALLGMIWADPKTCLTVPSSGLPAGRRVQVYCFAPPALTDAALSRVARKLVISFVYSNDVVSRLSLGSIRDIRNAAMWLCEANNSHGGKSEGEGYAAVTSRAKDWKAGKSPAGEMDWFVAMRKTLEASMQNVDMYPPGRVLWAMRDKDLHLSHQRWESGKDKLRLFDVLDVEPVFSQIVFAKNMLTAHMPHQYDQALHELL